MPKNIFWPLRNTSSEIKWINLYMVEIKSWVRRLYRHLMSCKIYAFLKVSVEEEALQEEDRQENTLGVTGWR